MNEVSSESRTRLGLLPVLVLIAATTVNPARAQCGRGGPEGPKAAARALVGLVTDELNQPLQDISVVMVNRKRQALTNARGEFTIDDLEPGGYTIAFRKIGFAPAATDVEVTETGGVARICMRREPVRLTPVTTSVSRGGLSGIISDAARVPLPGAEVRAMAANAVTTTDSGGRFFLDLKPGEYAMLVYKQGYARQILSVRIPRDSGREVAVWLGKPDGWDNRAAVDIDSMRWRKLKLPGSRYRVLTHEGLTASSMNLEQAIRVTATAPVAGNCAVEVAGTGGKVPLWSLDKNEIEFLEIVVAAPGTQRQNGGPRSRRSGAASCQVRLIGWLRK